MGLPKGRTNNPDGRPKGSKSKSSETLREMIINFIDRNLTDIQENYDQLEPKDKLMFLEKLFTFALPKMQSVKMESENVNNPPLIITLHGTPEEQARQKKLLEDVQRKLNEIDERD